MKNENKKFEDTYFNLFEENILNNESRLERILIDDPSVLKSYVAKRISVEGKKAEDSTAFKKIFNIYKESIENGVVDSSYFKRNYNARMYDHASSSYCFFDPITYYKLLTGKEWSDNETMKSVYINTFLSEDRTFFTLPVAPIIFKEFTPQVFLNSVLDAFVFKVPDDMDLNEYYIKNNTLLEILPYKKLKEGIANYLENNQGAIYGLYYLFNNNYSSTFSYEFHKANKINMKPMLKALWEIVLESDLDKILELDFPYELEDSETKKGQNLNVLTSALFPENKTDIEEIFGQSYFKHAPKIIDLLMDINEREYKYNESHCFVIEYLTENLLSQLSKKISLTPNKKLYIKRSYSLKNYKDKSVFNDLFAIKDKIVSVDDNLKEILLEIKKEGEWSEMSLNYDNISQQMNVLVQMNLLAIFGDELESKESTSLYTFLNENKNDLFVFELVSPVNRPSFERIVDFKLDALKKLVNFRNEECRK